MQAQPIDSVAAWPVELAPPRGVLVLTGYGVSVRVWRGRLRIENGVGRQRRTALVHRATGGLKRLVVLGHTGSISLEAIRWLADVGAAFIQIDADGRVLAAFSPHGTDRPGLRRAQAKALDAPTGNAVTRWLVKTKITAQAETLRSVDRHLSVPASTLDTLESLAADVASASDRDAIRMIEAQAAAVYWTVWGPLELIFARQDRDRVPAHWRAFGSRSSPLTGNPRLAANPANALLNYLYALLEGEASLAAHIVGLDPGLGVFHADQLNRDSLAADLMEPVRPLVDRYLLELLVKRSLAARDFFETRIGVCRVTPPLARELATTAPQWGRLVGRVAEDAAQMLEAKHPRSAGLPTPITGRRRAAARLGASGMEPMATVPRARAACLWCGGPNPPGRDTCSEACLDAYRAAQLPEFVGAGPARLAELRARGTDPSKTPAALTKLAASRRLRLREQREWEQAHLGPVDPELFRREILPSLARVTVTRLAKETGLSLTYCAKVMRSEVVPHPMWWERMAGRRLFG